MSWRDHLTDDEAKSLRFNEQDRAYHQDFVRRHSIAISRLRNTAVNRERRKAK